MAGELAFLARLLYRVRYTLAAIQLKSIDIRCIMNRPKTPMMWAITHNPRLISTTPVKDPSPSGFIVGEPTSVTPNTNYASSGWGLWSLHSCYDGMDADLSCDYGSTIHSPVHIKEQTNNEGFERHLLDASGKWFARESEAEVSPWPTLWWTTQRGEGCFLLVGRLVLSQKMEPGET